MARGERHEIRQSRHGAVVVHDFADDGGGIEAREPGESTEASVCPA
jgi:hypothetical protein